MRRRLLTVGLWLLCAHGAAATELSIFGGAWDTTDGDGGYGGGVRVAFFTGVQVEIGAGYLTGFTPRISSSGPDGVDLEIEADILPIDFGIRWDFREPGGIYVGGGGSLLLFESDGAKIDDELGGYLLVGFQYRLFFVELVFREAKPTVGRVGQGNDEIDLDEPIELDLNGPGLNLGFRF